MFKHILIATDGSPLAQSAALNALHLAKSLSAKVTAITVSAPFHILAADAVKLTEVKDVYEEHCEQQSENILGAMKTASESEGISFEGIHTFADRPYEAIIATATKRGCDAICMGSHGRSGVTALLVGSETQRVLAHTDIPVVVWRH